jgi:type III pantothenate kinase
MKLVIDIGNSRCKIGLFEGKECIEKKSVSNERPEKEVFDYLAPFQNVWIIVSSVGKVSDTFLNYLSHFKKIIYLGPKTPLPIFNAYLSPETFGYDRLCAAVGGVSIFSGFPILIIDSGTCITYDFISSNREFLGGSISPGAGMRFRALHQYTEKLPFTEFEKTDYVTGRTTKESILSGVINGVLFEMNGFIQHYRDLHEKLVVIISGGDSHYFADKLKKPIFAEPDLVLIGLNDILDYHLNKNS